MISRRLFLRGLFVAPAVVAASNLMPIRGIVMAVDVAYLPAAISIESIRDLLMPGLFDVRMSYDMIPRQWESVFRSAD